MSFRHEATKFSLSGKHAEVACIKCHPKEKKEGHDYQLFSGIAFNNCTDCHKDVHETKFGNDCSKCHTWNSFRQPLGMNKFDHNRTDFLLIGKHQALECKKCHKGNSYTTAIKFDRCSACHVDFHKGQIVKKEATSDCKDCHSELGFQGSSFTFERHNKGNFKLEGAHVSTPCISCHTKAKDWLFADLDKRCVGCHENIHKNHIKDKFILDGNCESCHSAFNWNKVTFDHKTSGFQLQGKHAEISCRDCHFKNGADNKPVQKFMELKSSCEECHTNVHKNLFNSNGATNCTPCHGFVNWKAEKFDRTQVRFHYRAY